MTYKTKTISYDARVRAFWALVGISVLSMGIYIYAVNATIRNTVAREKLEVELADIGARASALEFSYIALRNTINIDVAYAQGFEDVDSPTYVSRTRQNSLSMNSR